MKDVQTFLNCHNFPKCPHSQGFTPAPFHFCFMPQWEIFMMKKVIQLNLLSIFPPPPPPTPLPPPLLLVSAQGSWQTRPPPRPLPDQRVLSSSVLKRGSPPTPTPPLTLPTPPTPCTRPRTPSGRLQHFSFNGFCAGYDHGGRVWSQYSLSV